MVRLFAVDSSLYFSSSSLQDIESIINHDLCLLSVWARQWLVTFILSKTDAMLFALQLVKNFPSLIVDNTPIKFVEHNKHLGLIFSNDGKWHKHIDNILKSASKIIGLMCILKFELNRNALTHIYISYIRPITEYASVVWDGCSEQDSILLERLLNEAARIVTGSTRSVSFYNFL